MSGLNIVLIDFLIRSLSSRLEQRKITTAEPRSGVFSLQAPQTLHKQHHNVYNLTTHSHDELVFSSFKTV